MLRLLVVVLVGNTLRVLLLQQLLLLLMSIGKREALSFREQIFFVMSLIF